MGGWGCVEWGPERKLSPGTSAYSRLGDPSEQERGLFSQPLPSSALLQIPSAEAPISAH